ncbi:ABC transporter, ATP-binding protein [Filifactor alocis ATCC 35896]|uniref:ABC transporter, ATP-binding protein n=2 Tax=Filifactor TaxID=44259 RepID=D6GRM2_FILAD|nr:ABC transporter, ATP-binding protein [Filifactor alocis ATCC 35896]
MIGGLKMKNYYKKRFCLTDKGAENLVKATIACFFTYCVNLLPVFLLMMIVDQLVLNHVKSPIFYIIFATVTLILMYLLLSKEYINLYNATYEESANLRVGISETLADLPIAYFSKHNLSDLSQTIMSDVERIEHAISHSIPKVLGMGLFFPIMGILMMIGNVKMGLAVIIPTLVSFVFIPLGKKNRTNASTKYYDVLRENSESFQETIELQQEISSFNLTETFKDTLYRQMEESEKIHLKEELGSVLLLGISSLFAFVSVAVVILVGIILILNNEIDLLYLIGYIIGAIKVKELFDISKEGILELFYIDPAVERIREIKNTEVQQGKDVEIQNFNVEFRNVSFSYDADTEVLNDVSFVAKQNEVTALVGASGCGKTSILRLVSRLYDCTGGEILVGGQEIQNVSTDSLFQKISIVFQEVTLFNVSVMDNIRIGRKGATDEEVKKAAELANCMDFIQKLPNGFDTLIGENGAELSGGERQRLSIARAFLKDAPILILDEISASLDVDNEKKIQESLNKLIKNKTVIIISHRLKSIENVDKIVVIENGVVENIGTHAELMMKSKLYNNLVEKTKLAEEFVY